jgi:hypothetical protein
MTKNAARKAAIASALALSASLHLTTGAWAAPFTLTNGPGDGTVSVGVDGFGAFGSSLSADASDAIYDPVGAGAPAGTSFQSELAIRFGTAGARTFLATPGLANPSVTGSATSANSSFLFGGLSFQLQQTIVPLFSGGLLTGTELRQTYSILNTTASALSFEIVRYLDGDLLFDGSLTDGGGRLFSGPTEILFETDSATGSSTSTTFVGITALGGTIPLANRYEIDSFSGLRSRIAAGNALSDGVAGDGADADQFIDAGNGYDVTLALRNEFSLGAGGLTTYTTSTFFGSGAPTVVAQAVPEPGTALAAILVCGFVPWVKFGRPRRAGASQRG